MDTVAWVVVDVEEALVTEESTSSTRDLRRAERRGVSIATGAEASGG